MCFHGSWPTLLLKAAGAGVHGSGDSIASCHVLSPAQPGVVFSRGCDVAAFEARVAALLGGAASFDEACGN